MRRIYKNINNYFQGLSTLKFIIIMVLVTGLVIIPFIPLFYLYEKYIGQMGGADSIKEASLLSTIIVASIIGPIVETFIFQYGIIEILSSIKIFKEKNIIIAIISSLIFGFSHSYSYLYIFYGFIIGLLLAYSYLIYKKKNFSAFWVIFWIHCIRNTISTILFYMEL
ncbi:CPBP family glutamic-type intramembrane protease [Clostridium sp.]|jgi:membrane protease YdiL (CAAX protease family)|uniref:CPBP family glutamic-type intramembrane protease n=1 Tax=Clostridium sp. TaxID=1506 RepID=UPI003EEB3189